MSEFYNKNESPEYNIREVLRSWGANPSFGISWDELIARAIVNEYNNASKAREALIPNIKSQIIHIGLRASFSGVVLPDGKFAYATDTDTLYIGDNTTLGGIVAGGGISITKDTEANILSSTPVADALGLATDTDNFFVYDSGTTSWILVSSNTLVEPTTEDLVFTDTTDGAVLYKDQSSGNLYVKTSTGDLFRLNTLLDLRTAVIPGATPNQNIHPNFDSPVEKDVLYSYKDSAGNHKLALRYGDGSGGTEVSLGISASFDSDEVAFDVEYVDTADDIGLGGTEQFSIITGDSDSKGANGLPIIQGAQPADAGANPFPQVAGGRGTAPKGKLLDKRPYTLRGFMDTLNELSQSTQEGEIGYVSADKVGTVTLEDAGFWTDTITGTANVGGFCQYTVSDTTGIRVGDTLRVSGHAAAGDQKVTAYTATTVTTDAVYQAGTAGSVYALARIGLTGVNTELTYAQIFERQQAGVYVASDNNSIVIMSPDGTYYQAFGERRSTPIPGATPDQQVIPHVSSTDGGIVQIIGNTAWIINGTTGQKNVITLSVVDLGENYDVEATMDPDNQLLLGASEPYSVIRGHSDQAGANGIPIVQNMQKPAAGANQPRCAIGSGDPVLGPQYDKIPFAVCNYRGNVLDFVKIAQRGEICVHTDNKVYAAINSSGDASGTVASSGAGTITLDAGKGSNFILDDILYVSGCDVAACNGLYKVVSVATDTVIVTVIDGGSAPTAGATTGTWYKGAAVTLVASGTRESL